MKQAIVVSALLLACIGTTFADSGRRPIYEPIVIDGSSESIGGHYYVTRFISAPAGEPVIDIVGDGTSHVQIDLNGFWLGSTTAPTIRVRGSGLMSISLRNGFVQRDGNGSVIEIAGNTILASDDLIIDSLRIRGGGTTPDTGIHVTNVNKVVVEDSTIASVHTGILIQDTNPWTVGGSIVRNQFRSVDTTCIDVSTMNSLHIRQNNMIFVGAGIVMTKSGAAQVVGNSIVGGSGDGLTLDGTSQGAYIAGNSISQVSGDAIVIRDSLECMLIDNVISDSGSDGVFISGGGRHQIERNLVNDNAGYGLHMDGSNDNVYRNNTFRTDITGQPACTSDSPCDPPAVCDVNGSNNLSKENIQNAGECPTAP